MTFNQSTFPLYQLFTIHIVLILLCDHHCRTLMLLPLLVRGARFIIHRKASKEGDPRLAYSGLGALIWSYCIGDWMSIDPKTAPLVEEEIVEPAGEDSPDSPGTGDGIVRSVEDTPVDLVMTVHDFYHHMSEVRVDRLLGLRTCSETDGGRSGGYRQIVGNRDDARGNTLGVWSLS
ncbi:hypothetical protein Tco_0955010 [Tanacetum coccineum]|uniref:Uncharacterized protein n=1 Tax=Tanacetum coccineum TaxID=301880 RepID=A0ABQ5E626_9ASTR